MEKMKKTREGDTPSCEVSHLPLLIICHKLDMMVTEGWRHHIDILPQYIPIAYPPVYLHHRLSFPSFLSSAELISHSLLPHFLLSFAFIPCCLVANLFIRFLYIFHSLFHSAPSPCLNLHIFHLLFGSSVSVSGFPFSFDPPPTFLLLPSSQSHFINAVSLISAFSFSLSSVQSLTLCHIHSPFPSFAFENLSFNRAFSADVSNHVISAAAAILPIKLWQLWRCEFAVRPPYWWLNFLQILS